MQWATHIGVTFTVLCNISCNQLCSSSSLGEHDVELAVSLLFTPTEGTGSIYLLTVTTVSFTLSIYLPMYVNPTNAKNSGIGFLWLAIVRWSGIPVFKFNIKMTQNEYFTKNDRSHSILTHTHH